MSPALPELSVVLATDSIASIRKTLRYLRAQGDPARLEIIVTALASARLSSNAPELEGFPHVCIVRVHDACDVARAEAAGLRAATAGYVVFGENCSHPRPGFVDAILAACRSHEWSVVGPATANANPDTDTSWAGMWVNYGRYFHANERGPATRLLGHDSAYERRALLSLGDELDELLESLSVLQTELTVRGHRMYLEPSACVEILNVSRPGWYLIDQFGKGRQFATRRGRKWSPARRLVYVVGAPLIPLVRLARLVVLLRTRGRMGELWRGARPALLVAGLVMNGAGELVGYLVGGRTSPEYYERILHRSRYLHPDDIRRHTDESNWPA